MGKTRFRGLELTLRSNQTNYLEFLSEKHDLDVSASLRKELDRYISKHETTVSKSPKKERKFLVLTPRHILFLDELAGKAGLTRSDMARRVLDEMEASEQALKIVA